jgi:hypothetical protein
MMMLYCVIHTREPHVSQNSKQRFETSSSSSSRARCQPRPSWFYVSLPYPRTSQLCIRPFEIGANQRVFVTRQCWDLKYIVVVQASSVQFIFKTISASTNPSPMARHLPVICDPPLARHHLLTKLNENPRRSLRPSLLEAPYD